MLAAPACNALQSRLRCKFSQCRGADSINGRRGCETSQFFKSGDASSSKFDNLCTADTRNIIGAVRSTPFRLTTRLVVTLFARRTWYRYRGLLFESNECLKILD